MELELGLLGAARGDDRGDRGGVGDHGEPPVLGEEPGKPPGRRTAVEDDASAGGREQIERGSGDPVLLVGRGDVALGDGGLQDRQRVRGDGPAVDPVDQALPLEYGQIAADGLGGDPERLGCLAHAEPAIPGDEISDGALTLFGVQRGSPPADAWVVGGQRQNQT